MTQELVIKQNKIRSHIQCIIKQIIPFDSEEKAQIDFVLEWLAKDVEIFRIAKPATPDTHLVSYFVLLDEIKNKVLLVDHKQAKLWLPPGGQVLF